MRSITWGILFLIGATGLPAATSLRFNLEGAISPTFAKGDPDTVATVTRQALTPAELRASQRVSFALRMRNFEELNSRISRGEILSVKEMTEKYFPLPETWRRVASWVAAQGLLVEEADITHLTVAASSSVSRVQTALQMRFARVRGTDGLEYTSATSAPSLPSDLRQSIVSVLDLQPHIRPVPSQITEVKQLATGAILPQTFAQLYNTVGLGLDGAGQRIAILGGFPVNPDDLALFWKTAGLPTTLAQYTAIDLMHNPAGPGDNSHAGEETMDIEWASALAPGASLVYLNTLTSSTVAAWIIAEASAGRPVNQVTMSFGLPESIALTSQANREAESQYFASMAAVGTTVFISSGDAGSTQTIVNGTQPLGGWDPAGVTSPQYPASIPYVTAVGGTTVYFPYGSTAQIAMLPAKEGAWAFSSSDRLRGMTVSGGGISWYFARPSWQTGPGIPTGTMRCIPDVAAVASSNFPIYLQFRGSSAGASGTSLSSPVWAGLCALINQARARAGLRAIGLLGPKIYPLIGSACFNQMTTGSGNGTDGFSATADNGVYRVGPNYNLITGLGSPDMPFLIAALTLPEPDPTPAPPPPVTSPPSSPPPETPPPPVTTPTPTPDPTPTPTPTPDPTPTPSPTPTPTPTVPVQSASSGGGGGGSPSAWFYFALVAICLVRGLHHIRPGRPFPISRDRHLGFAKWRRGGDSNPR